VGEKTGYSRERGWERLPRTNKEKWEQRGQKKRKGGWDFRGVRGRLCEKINWGGESGGREKETHFTEEEQRESFNKPKRRSGVVVGEKKKRDSVWDCPGAGEVSS